jgi:Raf kinase inhibitor-like YbhB/YbcL family protein
MMKCKNTDQVSSISGSYRSRAPIEPWVVCIAMLAAMISGCSAENRVTSAGRRSGGLWGITVRSSAFGPEKPIPARFTAEGENISPPLHWTVGPEGTREFLLVVEDANSPGDPPAVHWIVYHIPPNVLSLPEGAASSGSLVEGANYKGTTGYAGPANKSSNPHHYYFQIFALSDVLNVDPHSPPTLYFNDWEGFVLSKGQLVGTY